MIDSVVEKLIVSVTVSVIRNTGNGVTMRKRRE